MKQPRFPGYRHMTGAQRRNARFDEIFERARASGDWPHKIGCQCPKCADPNGTSGQDRESHIAGTED